MAQGEVGVPATTESLEVGDGRDGGQLAKDRRKLLINRVYASFQKGKYWIKMRQLEFANTKGLNLQKTE